MQYNLSELKPATTFTHLSFGEFSPLGRRDRQPPGHFIHVFEIKFNTHGRMFKIFCACLYLYSLYIVIIFEM